MTPSVLVAGSLVALAVATLARRYHPVPSRVAELVVVPTTPRRRFPSPGQIFERVGRAVRSRLGRSADPTVDRRLGAALLAGLMSAMVDPRLGFVVGLAAWSAPLVDRRRRTRAHRRAVRQGLPDVIELFRLAIGTGLTVRLAVDAVAPRVDSPFAEALAEVLRRIGLGVRLADALGALHSLGDPVRGLVVALVASDRDGAPLGPALDRVAAEARMLRRRSAEEDARRLPVQLLFPLVVCILPAFGLLTVVPLLGGSVRSLSW